MRSLVIHNKKIAEIREYENNPRNNSEAVEAVAESINNFGFKVPIIIDRSGVIVAGHTRYKAAKKLKLKEVPCIVADDLTDEQVKAFRLADNMVAEKAEWDYELLSEVMRGLDCDLKITGFADWEIENILNPIKYNDLMDFYVPAETKEKEVEKVQCPHCGEWVEI